MNLFTSKWSRITRNHTPLILASAASLIVAAFTLPASASAATATWHGVLNKSPQVTLSFSFNGSHITKFLVPSIACLSRTGVQYELLFVPSIPVTRGTFSTVYHVLKSNPKVIVKVTGTIVSGHAAGVVTGSGNCDTSPQPFHANAGAIRPVTTPTIKAGSCSMSGCLASDGMYIKVTAIDRTLKSVAQAQGQGTIPADPIFQKGGVGVTITITDRSFSGPAVVAPAVDFQLRLGSGVLVQGGGPNGTVVSGNGHKYPCVYPPYVGNEAGGATLTKGASFGPRSVCFGAPTSADRQHLKLYYARGQGPVDAIIPLN